MENENEDAPGAFNAIQLFSSTHLLSDITAPKSRENLIKTLSTLDASLLTEAEIRDCFAGLRIAMAAFITKINVLEESFVQLKIDQVASETRLEKMCLQARDEIRSLRIEIQRKRRTDSQLPSILDVAQTLHGDLFFEVKVATAQTLGLDLEKLPQDFPLRLAFATQNGFKWNQNNRMPLKSYKQLEALEEWEEQFYSVQFIPLSQIADKSYVSGIGSGAVAGALMVLERELCMLLPERETHSIFNCYQKALKLFQENPTKSGFNIKSLVSMAFCHLPQEEVEGVENRLKMRPLTTAEQVISAIKKLVSKSTLPAFVQWQEGDISDTERLYSFQAGVYDDQLREFVKRYSM
jgi:hypothetical protein